MIPGSDEWKAWKLQRCGKATASRIADIVAKTKTGFSASRANYAAQLIAERLTGVPAETYSNAAMQWGTEKEPEARAAYEFFTGRSVLETGFVEHPRIAMAGASPDGLVGDDGLIEIKCPNTSTHIDTLLGESLDKKYLVQMQWQMACTGRKFCDFVSFDPRMPAELQMKVQKIARDDILIASLEADVREFLVEIEAKVARLEIMKEAA